ncbi:growth-regulated alpha protein-like isoform X2 [Chrysemys picta bellii]|uniref:growth-regulated alpha protein-like isoform X2 n=1 Tax=Chrysemys picta bellii TaxID=8478 RepID=UPI0032B2AAB9
MGEVKGKHITRLCGRGHHNQCLWDVSAAGWLQLLTAPRSRRLQLQPQLHGSSSGSTRPQQGGCSASSPLGCFSGPSGCYSSAPRTDAPMTGELQCQCLQTQAALIHPKRIANVELIPEGPHCGVQEVIATTKHGKKVCLDPTARWVKLIVTKILNSKIPVDQPALADTVIPMDRK